LLKNIPQKINKRLPCISSTQQVFNEAIPPYQKALDESGYNFKLTYDPPKNHTNMHKTGREPATSHGTTLHGIRKSKPTWEEHSLYIVDKCFTKKHPLYKILNRHALKLSYSCLPNIKSIIGSHNKTVLSNYT